MGKCGAKWYVFSAVLVCNRVWFVHSSLELGMFLEELATSSSFGDKTISLSMFTPTTVYVPQQLVTRRAPGLQLISSEIGYQIFDQV